MFVDEVIINLKAGDGGDGGLYFDKKKYTTHREPNGGHGGKGGDIYLVSDIYNNTLLKLSHNSHFIAENGFQGNKYNKAGRSGKDLIIKVPIGTLVWVNAQLIADINKLGVKLLVAKGGRGGKGNATYKINPLIAEKGSKGESVKIKLDLRLMADVGIVGLPNSGKSSLLSKLSAATPKIADYPFTTTTPNLGVAKHKHNIKSFTIVDIPAIIHGRGLKFIKHIYRTKILLYVVDYNKNDKLYEQYNIINSELEKYSKEIQNKVIIIVLNKIDLCYSQKQSINQFKKYLKKQNNNMIIEVSTLTKQGISNLIKEIIKNLEQANKMSNNYINIRYKRNIKQYIYKSDLQINLINGKFIVTGKKIQPFYTLMAKKNDTEILQRYYNSIIKRLKLKSELKKNGAQYGDIIQIGNYKFTLNKD
jgi:GTP-binding protein